MKFFLLLFSTLIITSCKSNHSTPYNEVENYLTSEVSYHEPWGQFKMLSDNPVHISIGRRSFGGDEKTDHLEDTFLLETFQKLYKNTSAKEITVTMDRLDYQGELIKGFKKTLKISKKDFESKFSVIPNKEIIKEFILIP